MATTHYSGPLRLSGKASSPYLAGANEVPAGMDFSSVVLYDDFTAVAVDTTNDWTVIKDTDATVGIVADVAGGWLALTSKATTDDDGASIQGNEIFLPAEDKSIFFTTRLSNNDVDQTDICVGLTENFNTNPEAMLAAANRVVFQVNDGSGLVLCKTEASGTETSTTTAVALADNVPVILSFRIVGTHAVYFYINGKLVATHGTNIPVTELAVGAMSLSGSATGTRATLIDYIGAIAER